MFEKIDVEKELRREELILVEAENLLKRSAEKDAEILSRLKQGKPEIADSHSPHIANNEFSEATIRRICINYRLRFLDTRHFRKDYPNEAIAAINRFEKTHGPATGFRIIAPAEAFELEDCHKDPLLFADAGNGKYYLLHKWGNDLSWFRRFLYFPLRSVYTYFYFMLSVAALFSFLIPSDWFNVQDDNLIYMRIWFTIHCFIGIFFFGIFIGAIMQTGFSSMVWKSKYMNE